MSAVKQDLPPKGGFPNPVRYARNIPARGPSGAVLFGLGTLTMLYGFYLVGQLNGERRELRREKAWARYYLVPLLQAEADRDAVRRMDATYEREAELMKDVPGWTAGDLHAPVPGLGKEGKLDPLASEPVYHNKEMYVAPSVMHLDPKSPQAEKAARNAGFKILKV